MNGRVLKSTGSFYKVNTPDGIIECKLGGRLRLEELKHTNPVSVGDIVILSEEGLIIDIEPRQNYLIRKSVNLSKQTHIIAANIDFIWIVATYKQPRTSTGFINRILITAEAYQIPCGILYNKKDLLNDDDKDEVEFLTHAFKKIGYPAYLVSAYDKSDTDLVRNLLAGKTSLFTGHSGSGKSTLLNAIDSTLNIRTGDISRKFEKGKHTTTFAEMFLLQSGGYVIDTPGLKEFGLASMQKNEISGYFREMQALRSKCKFYNCMHINEPDCEIIRGVSDGRIAPFRYDDYLVMITSDEVAD
ncbi:MAG: ribosome small subunit-dependent GTPase A [Candidatus Competibacteraceae bacterium]|nr:ribosome small subunit-dependent GTPase A [Candidatus Competibacteraceae bacterium]